MSVILSHNTALWAIRTLRAEGANFGLWTDFGVVERSLPWIGKHWSVREFASSEWRWPEPSAACELHVLVPPKHEIRMHHVHSHVCGGDLSAQSILSLDGHAGVVCPELLFVQMAETLELAQLVMLGYELCGTFTRSANRPMDGPVVDHVCPATTVDGIRQYLNQGTRVRGTKRARLALAYVRDGAASVPEAKLATMYELPSEEYGYGLGPITLNKRVGVNKTRGSLKRGERFPDILFSFAPIGINYDGEKDHLDLDGLTRLASAAALADDESSADAKKALAKKRRNLRNKAVDDMHRDRELLCEGLVVLRATKEDVNGIGRLDNFTRQLLRCAQVYFGVDVSQYEKTLDDSELRSKRYDLWQSL